MPSPSETKQDVPNFLPPATKSCCLSRYSPLLFKRAALSRVKNTPPARRGKTTEKALCSFHIFIALCFLFGALAPPRRLRSVSRHPYSHRWPLLLGYDTFVLFGDHTAYGEKVDICGYTLSLAGEARNNLCCVLFGCMIADGDMFRPCMWAGSTSLSGPRCAGAYPYKATEGKAEHFFFPAVFYSVHAPM